MGKLKTTPFWQGLLAYAKLDLTPFHTPGHKQGKGAHQALRQLLTHGLALDLCELEWPGLGHDVEAVLRLAEAEAARAIGAKASFFLWNGTTAGIQAMLLAVCREGDQVLVPRSAHRSVFAGLALCGAEPIYLLPEEFGDWGVDAPLGVEAYAAALERHPQVRAVVIINPSYYGLCPALKQIIELCSARGVLVLVDEAHGAHFPFHPELPPSGVHLGADLVAQSSHKVLGALTQASMLHLASERVEEAEISEALGLLQTSSPSFLLLASLDIARAQMATHGEQLLDRCLTLARALRQEIKGIAGMRCLDYPDLPDPTWALDPTRLVVDVSGLGLSGLAARALLRAECGVGAELADANNVVFILSYADGPAEAEKLLGGLKKLAALAASKPAALLPRWWVQTQPRIILSPRAAIQAPKVQTPLTKAAGQVCGALVAPYPPGIPVLCPGEYISASTVEYLLELVAQGWPVQGLNQNMILTVKY